MASQDLSARLRHLNDSAHLLATSAPATSKFLMSKCNSLMFDNEIEQPEAQRRKICGACGTIMILGRDATLKIESRRPRRGNGTRDGSASNPTRAMVYKCESCRTKTRLVVPPSTAKRRSVSRSSRKFPSDTTQTSNKTMLSTTPLPPSKPNTSTPSASSSSKKRAKSRKQGGLEALLARQRTVESRKSGFGLDLMDFMTKP